MKLAEIAALLVRFLALQVFLTGIVAGVFIPLPFPVASTFTDSLLHDTYTTVGSFHFGLGIAAASIVISALLLVFSKPLGKLLAKGLGGGSQ